jgi:hypothetical protein
MSNQDEQAERIKENLRDADFSEMTFSEMEDIFEDRDIAEFL